MSEREDALSPFLRSMIQDYFVLYSDRSFWQPLIEKLKSQKPLHGWYLDIGSGPGLHLCRMVRDFGGTGGCGYELREDMVAFASRIPTNEVLNIKYVQADGFKEVPKRSASLVMMHRVLHAIEDPVSAMKAVKALLPQGGHFLVSDWRQADVSEYVAHLFKSSPLSKEEIGELHKRYSKFSTSVLREMAEMVGFKHCFNFQFSGVMQCGLFELPPRF
jgi:SAM-dependent methyltransferase